MEPLEKIVFGGILLVLGIFVGGLLYSERDAATGHTEMGVATVVDKEHEIKKNDGIESNYFYFIVSISDGSLKRVKVEQGFYRGTTVGSKVIVDSRVGGLSKQVVDEQARPFEGAEAR